MEEHIVLTCYGIVFSNKVFIDSVKSKIVSVSIEEYQLSHTPTTPLLYVALVNIFVSCTITMFTRWCRVVEGSLYHGGPLSYTGNSVIWFSSSYFPERGTWKTECNGTHTHTHILANMLTQENGSEISPVWFICFFRCNMAHLIAANRNVWPLLWRDSQKEITLHVMQWSVQMISLPVLTSHPSFACLFQFLAGSNDFRPTERLPLSNKQKRTTNNITTRHILLPFRLLVLFVTNRLNRRNHIWLKFALKITNISWKLWIMFRIFIRMIIKSSNLPRKT